MIFDVHLAARADDRARRVRHRRAAVWEAADPSGVLAIVLGNWFEESDRFDELVLVERDAFADREQLRFRFRGHNAGNPFVVEQQAYLSARDDRIGWMRVLCSGFRPA